MQKDNDADNDFDCDNVDDSNCHKLKKNCYILPKFLNFRNWDLRLNYTSFHEYIKIDGIVVMRKNK